MGTLKSEDEMASTMREGGLAFLQAMEQSGFTEQELQNVGETFGVLQADFMAWEGLKRDGKISDDEAYIRNVITVSMGSHLLWYYLTKAQGTIDPDPNVLTIENASPDDLIEDNWEGTYLEMIRDKIIERDAWGVTYATENEGKDPTREDAYILMDAEIHRLSFYLWLVQRQIGER